MTEDNNNIEIVDNCKEIAKCDFPLIKFSEEFLQIDFVKDISSQDDNDKLVLSIDSKVQIASSKMKQFCYDIIDALIKYENKYNNGLGISLDSKKDDENGN